MYYVTTKVSGLKTENQTTPSRSMQLTHINVWLKRR